MVLRVKNKNEHNDYHFSDDQNQDTSQDIVMMAAAVFAMARVELQMQNLEKEHQERRREIEEMRQKSEEMRRKCEETLRRCEETLRRGEEIHQETHELRRHVKNVVQRVQDLEINIKNNAIAAEKLDEKLEKLDELIEQSEVAMENKPSNEGKLGTDKVIAPVIINTEIQDIKTEPVKELNSEIAPPPLQEIEQEIQVDKDFKNQSTKDKEILENIKVLNTQIDEELRDKISEQIITEKNAVEVNVEEQALRKLENNHTEPSLLPTDIPLQTTQEPAKDLQPNPEKVKLKEPVKQDTEVTPKQLQEHSLKEKKIILSSNQRILQSDQLERLERLNPKQNKQKFHPLKIPKTPALQKKENILKRICKLFHHIVILIFIEWPKSLASYVWKKIKIKSHLNKIAH